MVVAIHRTLEAVLNHFEHRARRAIEIGRHRIALGRGERAEQVILARIILRRMSEPEGMNIADEISRLTEKASERYAEVAVTSTSTGPSPIRTRIKSGVPSASAIDLTPRLPASLPPRFNLSRPASISSSSCTTINRSAGILKYPSRSERHSPLRL